jgi:hypothetical protein
MKGEGRPNGEITPQISNHMCKWYQEYHQNNKITPILSAQNPEGEAEDSHPGIQTPQVTVPRQTSPEVFNPRYGNESEDEEDSLENIKRDIDVLSQRLHEVATLSDIDQLEKPREAGYTRRSVASPYLAKIVRP